MRDLFNPLLVRFGGLVRSLCTYGRHRSLRQKAVRRRGMTSDKPDLVSLVPFDLAREFRAASPCNFGKVGPSPAIGQ